MIRKQILAGAMLVVLGACSGATGGTPVPTTDAEKQKLGGEIATLMTDPKMFDGMFESMKGAMVPSMTGMCEAAPEDKRAECLTKMEQARPVIEASVQESMDQAKAMMPEMMQDMGGVMAKVYTGQELAKMMDFYSSPEGKSIMQKQPQVMAEYMPKAMSRMQAMQMDTMKKMQERVAAAMADGAPPAAPAPAPN